MARLFGTPTLNIAQLWKVNAHMIDPITRLLKKSFIEPAARPQKDAYAQQHVAP